MGAFSSLYEPTLAASEVPLLARGASLAGKTPSAGVRGAVVAAHPVKLILGCTDGSGRVTISEARRLVEEFGAQIVVGALIDPEGFALREYARRRPTITVVIPSADQAVTLSHPLPNVFRFASDTAQYLAGLGSYAYRQLGWRKAIVLGEPSAFDYGEAAGFVAEFCSLGGDVVRRVWVSPGSGAATQVRRLAKRGIDGAAVLTLSDGVDLVRAFAPRGALRRRVVVDFLLSSALLNAFGARAQGVAWAWPNATDPRTVAWRRYAEAVRKTFPAQPSAVFASAVDYYTSMEAVLRALETVHGDLPDGERRFRAALAATRFESPLGPVRLDRNRQLVATNQVALVDATAGARIVRTIHGIDESFGGYFQTNDPPPGPDNPPCRHGSQRGRR